MITRSFTVSSESGRDICVFEAGHQDGVPILVHSGTPGSRLPNRLWMKDAQAMGVRLIGYDRPGYGGSSPDPGRVVATAARDVLAIADALSLKQLAVWGWSGGGPHALACAALLPDLVVAAASLASLAPYKKDDFDWLSGMGNDNVLEFTAALKGRNPLKEFLEAIAPGLLNADPQSLLQAMRTLLSPVDAAVVTGDFVTDLLNSTHEGIGEKLNGWVDDDLAFMKPWGFTVSQISIPVLILHGEQDRFVPFSHGEWLARSIPNVDARLSVDDGHMTLAIDRIPEGHSWLLDKMK